MTKARPIPDRPEYQKRLRKLRARSSVFLKGAKQESVKAIASRLGKKLGRRFLTEKAADGVTVWRVV